ncbi:MAG: hypothetical protein DMG32_06425 [Acidobacteria bacterium]|nr:MAG: hypothetical protein DMG32_06425 [Acidobacteriota bacterium]
MSRPPLEVADLIRIAGAAFLERNRQQQPPAEQHPSSTEDSPDLYRCPKCGGTMKVIERLTAAEIQLRSPPVLTTAT